jgi:hypothetical protein
VPRPLSPAFLLTFAQALVDDASAVAARDDSTTAASAKDAADCSPTFVHHAGYWSHFDYRMGTSVWPLPETSSCTELAAFAAERFVLATDAPEPGDVYLLWSPAKKLFVRSGIVLSRSRRLRYPSGRRYYDCLTIDGDTASDGSLRGGHTAVVQRALSPSSGDRLIRWPLLELTSVEQPRFGELPRRRAA